MDARKLARSRGADSVSDGRLRGLVAGALERAEEVLGAYSNPLVGYSGGKDALVAHHLVNRVRPGIAGYYEASFHPGPQRADIERTIDRLGFNVTIGESFPYRWLARRPSHLFADDLAIRAKDCSSRHQAAVKKAVRDGRHDLTIWGRRIDHNSVPSVCYTTREGPQFHPIRDWTLDEVWAYIEREIGVPRPYVYSTRFGELTGTAAFYSFRAREVGDLEECWAVVDDIDPTIRPRYEAAAA
jgi:3'-phosphoadenosine 5'-phosphosulfate sulfotransferase (PAPS reductase)/FAD synthetase